MEMIFPIKYGSNALTPWKMSNEQAVFWVILYVSVRIGVEKMSGGSDISQFGKPLARDHSEQAIRSAFRRKWTFWGLAIGILIAAAGVFALNEYQTSKERTLTTEYLKAQSAFESELEAFSKSLENSENLENISDLKPDHSRSTPLFRDFAEKHPHHPLGWQAALRVAQQAMKEGNHEEVKALLQPIVGKTRRFPIMQVKIRRALAGVYAELGEYGAALDELKIVEQVNENPAKDQVLLFKAQLLYLSGDKEAARELLESLSTGLLGLQTVSQDVSTDAGLWLDYWKLK